LKIRALVLLKRKSRDTNMTRAGAGNPGCVDAVTTGIRHKTFVAAVQLAGIFNREVDRFPEGRQTYATFTSKSNLPGF
jgi:hypothetical protein